MRLWVVKSWGITTQTPTYNLAKIPPRFFYFIFTVESITEENKGKHNKWYKKWLKRFNRYIMASGGSTMLLVTGRKKSASHYLQGAFGDKLRSIKALQESFKLCDCAFKIFARSIFKKRYLLTLLFYLRSNFNFTNTVTLCMFSIIF